jgi:hypothetical protein
MAGKVLNKVVTNDLVLYLDAANPKSYPGSGTTWYDLSPSIVNSTLNGNVVFNSDKKYMSLPSVSDYVNVSSNIKTTFNGAQNASLSCWVSSSIVNASDTSAFVFGFHKVGNYDSGYRFAIDYQNYASNPVIFFTAENGGASYVYKNYSIQGSWTNLAITYDGSQSGQNKIAGYVNGILLTGLTSVNTLPTTLSLTLDNFNIGYATQGNNTLVSTAQAYNRTLSQAEVLQNFNALKTRFGL